MVVPEQKKRKEKKPKIKYITKGTFLKLQNYAD